jgi:hypothetical protein
MLKIFLTWSGKYLLGARIMLQKPEIRLDNTAKSGFAKSGFLGYSWEE